MKYLNQAYRMLQDIENCQRLAEESQSSSFFGLVKRLLGKDPLDARTRMLRTEIDAKWQQLAELGKHR